MEDFLNIEDLDSELLNNRHIFLLDNIDSENSIKLCKQLIYLNSVNDDPIYLFINSMGGDVNCAFSIIDTIESIDAPVYTVAFGCVYSSALAVFVAGETGHRYTTKRCHFLIHPIGHYSSFDKSVKEAKLNIKITEDMSKMIKDIFKNHSKKRLHKKLLYYLDSYEDNYFFAKEAIQLGVADKYY